MTTLLLDQTTTTTGDGIKMFGTHRTFQSVVTGTGAVTATVLIDVSNDGTNFKTASTHTLSGTTTDTAAEVQEGNFNYVRARLTAISGTGAAVTVTVGD